MIAGRPGRIVRFSPSRDRSHDEWFHKWTVWVYDPSRRALHITSVASTEAQGSSRQPITAAVNRHRPKPVRE